MTLVRGRAALAGAVSALLVAAGSGVLGLLTGPIGAVVCAAIGLALGAVYGWAVALGGPYDFGSPRGVLAFLVDHTWSMPNTVAGTVFLLVNLVRGNRLDMDVTTHRGHVCLRDGALRGWVTTIGPVQAGSGVHINRHEAVHVLQARIFGPLYFPLVGVNYLVATVLPYWLLYHDRTARPIRGARDYFRRGVYPHTWHEEWAYRVEGTPPL